MPALKCIQGTLYLISRMLKTYKKIHKFSKVTTYFSMNKWKFGYDNAKSLWDNLSREDQTLFPFSMRDFDWDDFMKKCVAGLRIHVFKDDPSTIPMARKRMAKFIIVHNIIKYLSIAWLLYILYTLVPSIESIRAFSMVIENIRAER